jgi:hypothetical protein
MSMRPSHVWKDLSVERRGRLAEAFWRDEESAEIAAQHAEAAVMLARRLNFRPKSIQNLSVDRRAKHLAQFGDVSDSIATRALVAYHFAHQRPLMAAFLDALGITHDSGLITDEAVTPPAPDRLAQAIATLRPKFENEDIDLYLRTLMSLDGETWKGLEGLLSN